MAVKGKKKREKIVKICQLKIKKNQQKVEKSKYHRDNYFFFFFFFYFERNRGGKKWEKEFMANSKQMNSMDWISSKSF